MKLNIKESRGWNLQIPQKLANKLRNAISNEEPATILEAIKECYEFLTNEMPQYFSRDEFEELVADLDSELDNLENYEQYDMTYDDVIENIDAWLDKLYRDCDDVRVFIPLNDFSESKTRKSRSRKLKEVYTHGLRVYEGWDNFQNYIFVWDLNRDDNDTRIVDWDLSDDEVYDLAKRIYEGEYNIDDNSVGGDWESWDSVTSGMHGFREISED